MIVRNEDEIKRVLDWTKQTMHFPLQTTRFPGWTYEMGIDVMYNWLIGVYDDPPDSDPHQREKSE
jgi:hypothetical protein